MGTVLAVLGVLAVLFVASLVATRDGELLVDAPRDRPDPGLPTGRALRAGDLDRVRFPMALRGYRMADVDALLDRLAAELRDRDDRVEARDGEPVTAGEQLTVDAGDPVTATVDGDPAGTDQELPEVEHLPDDAPGAEPLPGVIVRPGADPPAPVPFPEPVHVDEPVDVPPAEDRADDTDHAASAGPAVPAAGRR